MRYTSVLMTLTLLAGCTTPRVVAPPHLSPATVPAPPPAVAAAGPDWRDWPLTPGVWRYVQDARGSIALFGPAGGEAALALRCDRAARMIYLSRAGAQAATLTLRTTDLTRVLNAAPTGSQATPFIAVALQPADPLLDAMGFSRGRIVLEQTAMAPLVIPVWAEIERVTEDCRG